MSKPNEGFDFDSYDFTEYASALDGENPSSTDCDMESESIWTPSCNNVAPVTNLCLGRATTRSHSSQWSKKKL